MPSFNGSDIERDRMDSAKVRGRHVRNVSIAMPGRNYRNGDDREKGRGMLDILVFDEKERERGEREALSPHSNRGDEAVCRARKREFTAEVPLTDYC